MVSCNIDRFTVISSLTFFRCYSSYLNVLTVQGRLGVILIPVYIGSKVLRPSRSSIFSNNLRPGLNVAPLMCRTKLNTVRLWSDFRATADSDGVLASDLIGEGHGKQFSMRIQLFRQRLSHKRKSVRDNAYWHYG